MADRRRRVRARDMRSRRSLTVVGTVLVLAVGGAIAARTVDLGAVVAALRDADPLVLAAAVVCYLLSWPIRGRRYDDVLAAMGHRCGVGFLTVAVFLSQTVNLAVPARAGDGIRAYLVNSRRNVPYATGAASLAVERAFDLVAITLLGGVAVAWLAVTDGTIARNGATEIGVPGVVGVAGLTVVLSVVAVGVARSDRTFGFGSVVRDRLKHPRVALVVDAALRFGADVRTVATDPRALVTIGAGSLAVWVLDGATAVLILAALGTGMSVSTLVAVGLLAVSVGNLAKVLPLSQGGIGLYEAAFTAVVVAAVPVGAGTALAAAILDHAIKNVVTLCGGGLATIWVNVSPTLEDGTDRLFRST